MIKGGFVTGTVSSDKGFLKPWNILADPGDDRDCYTNTIVMKSVKDSSFLKLYGVGPVDNRPSTDKHQDFRK